MAFSSLLARIKEDIVQDRELSEDVVNEVVAKYPLSKSCLKYLFTLYEELEEEVVHKRNEIERLKNVVSDLQEQLAKLSEGFNPELERLKLEKREVEERYTEALEDYNQVAMRFDDLLEFLRSSFFGRIILSKWERMQ